MFGKHDWAKVVLPRLLMKLEGNIFSRHSEPRQLQAYLDRLQKVLDNQYYLVFQAIPKSKPGLQRVNISTQVADAEIAAADSVWIPVTNEAPSAKKD